MHCCIVWPGALRLANSIFISHSPGLRDGSSAANAGITPITPTIEIVVTSRMTLLLAE
jgi:hypothetical protein